MASKGFLRASHKRGGRCLTLLTRHPLTHNASQVKASATVSKSLNLEEAQLLRSLPGFISSSSSPPIGARRVANTNPKWSAQTFVTPSVNFWPCHPAQWRLVLFEATNTCSGQLYESVYREDQHYSMVAKALPPNISISLAFTKRRLTRCKGAHADTVSALLLRV
ncbi:hypothetical protein IE81DRAFT_131270 [Ceraceosorus guamensis]|uniref:Uncharacterized protein n=1 Tax=Ceraceosorus guamensis TaxID=1522189 RepID=A0A316WDP0_9BASI|nr:hypothetical protein IE81DRAFT_131270 [Ceraceosorus guamensis]PWN45943.1 hypothetical protein IE81DRAFT_131270 [Ceraceosorus guamensis]